MKELIRGLMTVTLLFIAGRATAAIPHGVYSGDQPLWVAGLNLRVTAGSGVVDNLKYTNVTNVYALPAPGSGLVFVNEYCYVVNTLANGHDTHFSPSQFTFVCEQRVPPLPDGHPSAPVTDGTFPASASAAFVGSIINNDYGVVPFFRNGEQVILTPESSYASSFDTWFQYGQTTPVALPPQMISKNQVMPLKWTISLFPASASQAILDNMSGTIDQVGIKDDRYMCFLDPNNHAIGAGGNRTCQAELAIDRVPNVVVVDYVHSYSNDRLELNADSGGAIYYGADTTLLLGNNSLYVYLALRGYVEPISHLQAR
jgi:hypothetical protein